MATTTTTRALSPYQVERYSRHIIMPQVGSRGQRKLMDAKVLIIGAGGLGSPIAIYLALAGVGTLGIVDFDTVDLSNLQRQILHHNDDIGRRKVVSAQETIKSYNPEVNVVTHEEPLTSDNAMGVIADYDIVVNGADNFPARYLVNDAAYLSNKPLVDGSILLFDGQADRIPAGPGVLSMPLPRAATSRRGAKLRRGRGPGDAAGTGRLDPGHRDRKAHSRRRQIPGRAATAHRRSRHGVSDGQDPPQSRVPPLRRQTRRSPS